MNVPFGEHILIFFSLHYNRFDQTSDEVCLTLIIKHSFSISRQEVIRCMTEARTWLKNWECHKYNQRIPKNILFEILTIKIKNMYFCPTDV